MSLSGTGSSRENALIVAHLVMWNEASGTGVAFEANGGFVLPDGSMFAADAAWLRLDRWNALTVREQGRFAPVCPDFIVELRSPSDSGTELRRKMEAWMSNGAQLAWLVDPRTKIVEIYRPGREPELFEEPAEVHGEGPVAGFVLKMGSIWS